MQIGCNGESYRKVTGVTLTFSICDPYKRGVIQPDQLESLPEDIYGSQALETPSSELILVLPRRSVSSQCRTRPIGLKLAADLER